MSYFGEGIIMWCNEHKRPGRCAIGLICHHGYSMTSGHYTAYVSQGSQWYCMDDEKVCLYYFIYI